MINKSNIEKSLDRKEHKQAIENMLYVLRGDYVYDILKFKIFICILLY